MTTPNVSSDSRDAGFTLPEMLVAIAIGALIMGAITASLIVLLKSEGETTDRLNASRTTQLVGTWLPVDTLSSAKSGWDCNGNCGAPAPSFCSTTGTKVLHLPYANSGPDSNTMVDYRLEPSGSTKDLVRYQCIAGGGAGTRIVLGHELASAVATIDCPGNPSCTGPVSTTVVVTTDQGLAATYTGNSRNGTAVAAPTTTSSGGGTTTTTTAPTTTTTSTTTTSTSLPLPKLHVSAITSSGVAKQNQNSWHATITVTVVDQNGSAISGVTVTGAWSPTSAQSGNCSSATAVSGQCNNQTQNNAFPVGT